MQIKPLSKILVEGTYGFLPCMCFASLFLVIVAFFVYGSHGQDDAHIIYVVARNVVEGFGPTNINQQWVEQASSLLHVYLLAVFHTVSGLELTIAGPVLSLLMALACLPLTWMLAGRLGITQKHLPVILTVVSNVFAYWSIGGLESTLAAFFMLSLVHVLITGFSIRKLSLGHCLLTSFVILGFLLVRPESFFVLAIALAILSSLQLNQNTAGWFYQRLLQLFLVALLGFALLSYWRYLYFGQVFPQAVYAKTVIYDWRKLLMGLSYFAYTGQLSVIVFSLVLLVPLKQFLQRKPFVQVSLMVTLALTCSYLAFIIVSGGDWMGGGRFFVPVLPLMACLFCYYARFYRRFALYCSFILVFSLFEIAIFSRLFSTGVPVHQKSHFMSSFSVAPDITSFAWTEYLNLAHIRDLQLVNAIDPVIKELTIVKQPLSITSIQMGMIPYHLSARFSRQLHFIDLRGLTTPEIIDCPYFTENQKTWWGVHVTYREYMQAITSSTCGLKAPDVIYDLLNLDKSANQARIQALVDHGYHIVYRQQGRISALSGFKAINTPMFIAVHDDLYRYLPAHLQWREFSLGNQRQ